MGEHHDHQWGGGMSRCATCVAELSAWELRMADDLGARPCWCKGVPSKVPRTLPNVAYAALCDPSLARPVKIHDVVRFVATKYNGNPRYSINVALSQDKRFCWS